jgi:hypothetical protein
LLHNETLCIKLCVCIYLYLSAYDVYTSAIIVFTLSGWRCLWLVVVMVLFPLSRQRCLGRNSSHASTALKLNHAYFACAPSHLLLSAAIRPGSSGAAGAAWPGSDVEGTQARPGQVSPCRCSLALSPLPGSRALSRLPGSREWSWMHVDMGIYG